MSLAKQKTVTSEKIRRGLSADPDDLLGNPDEVDAEWKIRENSRSSFSTAAKR